MFLLPRNAASLKDLKNIFHIRLILPKEYSASLFFQKNKMKERKKIRGNSYLIFVETFLSHTENTEKDKKIVSDHYIYWYIKKGKCFDKKDKIKYTFRIIKLYLNSKYIAKSVKN